MCGKRKSIAGLDPDNRNDFVVITKQLTLTSAALIDLLNYRSLVSQVELTQLDENRAALLAVGLLRRTGRIADVGTGRIVAMLVRKDAVEH